MELEANKTVPFRDVEHVGRMMVYLADNYDPVYLLIFRIAVCTGLRISDVLGLQYNTNVFGNRLIVTESKGRKASIARIRNKNLEGHRQYLILSADNDEQRLKYSQAHISKIYGMLKDSVKEIFDYQLEDAVKRLKTPKRHCGIPEVIAEEIRVHHRKYKKIDGGFVFSRAVLRSNMCRNKNGTISRQMVWRVFSDAGKAIGFDFPTSCHQLRKTFAVFLYKHSGNNSAMTIKEIGWKDEKILQRYLAVEDGAAASAIDKIHADIVTIPTKI